jgi:hypothetical protein
MWRRIDLVCLTPSNNGSPVSSSFLAASRALSTRMNKDFDESYQDYQGLQVDP